MSDATLEDLAVYQLCAFAARRKAFVRLANAASAGGRKRNNDFAPLRNIFNEWLVRDTSKKIKAVRRSKGMSGKPITSKPVRRPFDSLLAQKHPMPHGMGYFWCRQRESNPYGFGAEGF